MIPDQVNTMTHASLFSGIGGAELAARWVGWKNVFHCEINPFGRRVIEYHFPESKSYEDVTTTDFSEYRGRIDVLTAGFPCQPFSVAGQRKGAEDNRYLWPEVVRVIREVRPNWVVGENVAGILTMVQPGKEVEVGSDYTLFGENDRKRVLLRQEYVIETICRDLEREGYEVQPFVIPACAVGAPHRRDRVWIIAHRSDAGVETVQCGREDGVYATGLADDTDINRQRWRKNQQVTVAGCKGASYACACGEDGVIANTKCFGGREIYDEIQSQQSDGQRAYGNGDERFVTHNTCEQSYRHQFEQQEALRKTESESGGEYSQSCYELPADRWRDFPTQPPIRSRYDGISANVVRYIKQEVYDKIGENIGREDLSGLWKAFQKKEIREKIGRSYEIPEPDLLLKVLQCSSSPKRNKQREIELSPFSEETSERVLRVLRKYGTFRCSPFGQKYKEQFTIQFGDSLPQLSHEIALATKKIIEECEITASKVRKESIKAYGNAMCPQVVYEIFKAIEETE